MMFVHLDPQSWRTLTGRFVRVVFNDWDNRLVGLSQLCKTHIDAIMKDLRSGQSSKPIDLLLDEFPEIARILNHRRIKISLPKIETTAHHLEVEVLLKKALAAAIRQLASHGPQGKGYAYLIDERDREWRCDFSISEKESTTTIALCIKQFWWNSFIKRQPTKTN